MGDDLRTQRYGRIPRPATDVDRMQGLRAAIVAIRESPRSSEPRRMLRALATEIEAWEPLSLLLADEARAATDPDVAVAFYQELADVSENLDRPDQVISAMEQIVRISDNVDHHERLAWLYRRARKWEQAAACYERVADLAVEDRAYKALRAAARLYRDNGRAEPAAATYRAIVARRPTDVDAWRALDELYGELQRWDELADVRAELAGRSGDGVVRASLLRASAEALDKGGHHERAATMVEEATNAAPVTMSQLVDTVFLLARAGKPREAADLLQQRVDDAIAQRRPDDEIATLRNQLASMLEDGCGDRPASAKVLEELLADYPMHLAALERFVWQASHDPDPRKHAIALVRLAAATPIVRDKLAAMREAGRRFYEATDYKSAARSFEKAAELAPGDSAIAIEVVEANAALAVELAKSEAFDGKSDAAETRLRAIVDANAKNLDASIALAEIYQRSGRLETARDHLAMTLSSAPDDVPPAQMAQLLYRNSLVVAALGDDEYAHQLLHEAHHLARRDLPITLVLGESCFARKLWREAAIHLGGLADHPDAPKHAAAVATGLVHAAQAEIRGLRHQNAVKHFDNALKLDPNCAVALHALAEQAIEKGDTVRGVELLEREASVTPEPEKQLRLLHALGDLAVQLLGDEQRAMRCWAAVPANVPAGNPEALAEVLEKLVVLQRTRNDHGARGETCARLSACVGEPRATELMIEALRAFADDGDLVRARELATELVARAPHDAGVIDAATTIVIALGDFDLAKSWLRPALTVLDKADPKGDALRAELWRRLGDAERARDNERSALLAYQRAVAIAADSPGGIAARRGVVELAAKTGASVATTLTALVEAEQDPMETLAWARALAGRVDADPEDVRAAYELADALGAPLSRDDEHMLAALPDVGMASDQAYGAALDDNERAALIDDDEDGPLGELCALVWEAAALIVPAAPVALARAGLADAKRLSPVSDAATASIYPQIAKMLGGPPVLMHTTLLADADLAILCASPPIVLVGVRLAGVRARSVSEAEIQTDASLRWKLGRIVELTRPKRVLTQLGREFTVLVRALEVAYGGAEAMNADVEIEADRLRTALPVALRKRVVDLLVSKPVLEPAAFRAACDRAADRAGLLACGHVDIAVEMAGGPDVGRHVVRTASTQRYLFVRKKLKPPKRGR